MAYPEDLNLQSSQWEERRRRELRTITPEGLWDDNHSLAAQENLATWDEANQRKKLVTVKRCSDARVIAPKSAFYVSAIAAGGIVGPYLPLVERSQAAIVVAHYDGSTAIPGHRPTGCGGQDEKAKMSEEEKQRLDTDDVRGYVSKFVTHEDPIVNALFTAGQLSDSTDKTVLAAAQDHLTGNTKVFAVFDRSNGKHQIRSAIPWGQMIKANTPEGYDPRILYESGVPELDAGDIPEFYAEILEQQNRQVRAYEATYGDLSKWNKVQNPAAVIITEDARPKSVTNPKYFGGPNSGFVVRMPRMYSPQNGVSLNEFAINLAIRQAEYALGNSVQNARTSDKPFRDLRTVFIETRHPEVAQAILDQLKGREVVQRFLELPGSQILSGIVDQGILLDCSKVQL